ncbi:hypothetical protein EHI8A_068500 [Entamoeba histolytica HM-1:IMSS-B]|uniref:Uncharacterized protein n=6 Tax=Entamoeba histolytica TaxID=5759 RepID=C4M0R5_ENTH1|nr:hypothetical protein EHI_010010 [Entamoeba histolytica HM-1:IMSS]EMD43572.1 Hypothetical protein EHI5A_110340 [Entamoeba histolytica KU27]EMH75724.1 hypothetical protein EHI8A_068500 [Entamoeba histolytica HM-1:IMSS-B]EMS17483.1 hypothetical protein KM1_128630 [Entamoeba histolytica HM-3:IMSS]ENY61775.1 hypothetical protein EHI7A_066850 [Entamoeba histolytica HM-1:IMSS-A]BAN39560.1 hypothetical protein [Entamoeba histolytica]|eukprot:XP_657079.1 hypothetical protein EHI_010010 [Entamoeba histolytica HM-1:IMSS]
MTTDPSVIRLTQILASYTNSQVTPFKLKMNVSQNDSERKFIENYIKECGGNLPTQQQSTSLFSTGLGSSTGLSTGLGSSTSSGFGLGSSTSSGFGLSSFGGFNTSSSGGFGFNQNQQNQNTTQTVKPVPGEPDLMEIEICFFKGLEMRSKYQDERQVELISELTKLQKDVQDIMKSIQEQIIEKYESMAEHALKMDEEIIAVLTRDGDPDADVLQKFKELLGKIDVTDTEKKVQMMLNIVNSKPLPRSDNGETLDKESSKEVVRLLSEEQNIIISLTNEINELKAKYEQLKLKVSKMKIH